MDTPVKCLANSISRFIHLVSCQNVKLVALQKDYKTLAFILKTLKLVLDDVLDYDIFSDEMLCKECEELDTAVNMAREFIEDWSPKMSKICSVLQSEPLLTKIQGSLLIICTTLGRPLQSSSPSSSSTAIQRCMQEIQSLKQERVADYIEEAMRSKRNDIFPCTKSLMKIIESLGLTCSQELLKENIALGKERMNSETSLVKGEVNPIDQVIDLVSSIRDCMVKLQRVGPVSVPAYFCCPLSSELMVDPVIIASGQTYDRFAIQKWLDNGLTVCPKTRQKLAHTNLIPNYTVKAMIATWCDENKVKLPANSDRTKTLSTPLCSDGFQDLLQSSDPNLRSSEENGGGFEKRKESEIGEIANGCSRELSYSHSRTESTSSAVSSTDYAKPEAMSEPFQESTPKAEPGDSHPELAATSDIKSLVEGLKSLSVEAQTSAAEELRLLAKHNVENRGIIGRSGAIAPLLSLLYSESKRAQEHAVTALLNLSIDEDNKAAIAESGAIEPLIHVLRTGSDGARENSAATLFSLSVLEEYKAKIGRSGAVKSLVDLLGSGTLRGKKDAATALFNLSIFHENKARIVQAGAVKHLVRLLDPSIGMVDKSVALLANLSTIGEGRSAIVREGGIPLLVEIVEGGSQRGKENAASVLMQLCLHSSKFCTLILQEGAVPPLVALSQSGTPRAKEKAQQLLSHFRNQREGTTGKGKS